MTTFLTKVWGFDSPSGPLQFRDRGWRERARQLLEGGPHQVILVGTLGPETPEHQRGRVIGMMEPTTEPVASLDYEPATRDIDYDEQGNYRWPYALHNKRAWMFLEPLAKLSDLSDRKFYMDAATGIVEVDQTLASRIKELPLEEIPLLQKTIAAQLRIDGAGGRTRRTSPPPTTQRTGVMHMRRAPAYTYAFQIGGAKSPHFKVGWAFSPELRRKQFNRVALSGLGGIGYHAHLDQLWETARQAYAMEQAVLKKLSSHRRSENHEVVAVSIDDLTHVWTSALLHVRGRHTR